ncbi:hypothetical protein [Hymenobacter sp. HDW8]|uniref:hypothetical protein n=1 Tax=Hymenobacter sp. HDW8 TaxID=2714932 RepID=UPI00140967ED|nr:hypothetical protein [Hymenobacter sp. HDW8]QIL78354.1 hypothetical protein G7064_21300 [Hymenobacter sp. HDW8]
MIAQIEASFIRYPVCNQDVACLECAAVPVQVGSLRLTDYFRQALPLPQTNALTGMVLVHIDIDDEGVPCCRSVQNYTDSPHPQVQQLNLDRVVAAMPRWQLVRQNDHAVSSSTSLRFVFAGPAGFYAEPFFTGGLHPQLTDTLGMARSGWRWVVPPQPVVPLQAGEYAQFEFSIGPTGKVHSVNLARTNATAAQEASCRQALEAAALQPVQQAQQQDRGYFSFIGK